MKKNHKTLNLSPYPCVLKVYMLDKLPDCGGRTYADSVGNIYVEYEKESFPDLVVHESTHVKQFLEKYCGTKLDSESEAYLMQHIVTWTYNAFADFIGNTNKKGK